VVFTVDGCLKRTMLVWKEEMVGMTTMDLDIRGGSDCIERDGGWWRWSSDGANWFEKPWWKEASGRDGNIHHCRGSVKTTRMPVATWGCRDVSTVHKPKGSRYKGRY
jgi:hypothetical protein